MASATVKSKAAVLLLLIRFFVVAPIVGVGVCFHCCCALLCVLSGFAVVLMGKRLCLPGILWLLCGSYSNSHGLACNV